MKKGKIVVHTAGTFDLFHIGHLNILKRSKELGDILVVAVSTDELVESYKDAKPYIPFEQRVEIVKSIKYVDIVIKQEKLHDINQLKQYEVDITTIGSDWENKYLEGIEWMKNNGKKVVYLPYTQGISSTIIKEWIYKQEEKNLIQLGNKYIITSPKLVINSKLLVDLLSQKDDLNYVVVDRWIGEYDEYDNEIISTRKYKKSVVKVSVDNTWKIREISENIQKDDAWGEFLGIVKINEELKKYFINNENIVPILNKLIKSNHNFYPFIFNKLNNN